YLCQSQEQNPSCSRCSNDLPKTENQAIRPVGSHYRSELLETPELFLSGEDLGARERFYGGAVSIEASPRTRLAGGLYAGGAYLLWGVLPLYFLMLMPTGPWEVVAARVLFSLVFCMLLLTVARGWRRITAIIRQPRLLG